MEYALTPKVSIIIPAYNVSDYIKPCIESCINQDYNAIEIIVVNDGSTDDTLVKIENLCNLQPDIKLINKPNGGVTAARQTGLEASSGEYIFFLDGDDRLCIPDSITNLVNRAKETNADHVSGDFIIVHKDGRRTRQYFPPFDLHNSKEALAYAFLNNDFYYTGRLLRRALIVEVNKRIPRDITYGEDTYAVVNLLSMIQISAKVNAPILEYVQRAESVTNRLTVHDLMKRNKATALTLEVAKKMQFESFASSEIRIYALRELYQSITLGVPNNTVANIFLKRLRKYSSEIKSTLGYKPYLILQLAAWNMPLTCKIIQILKKLR